MKQKSSGVFRARLAAREFKQDEGTYCLNDDKSSPVITDILIVIVMEFTILANWSTRITDVEEVFLHGSFQNKNEKVFTQVPLELRERDPPWALLLLLATIYETIQ